MGADEYVRLQAACVAMARQSQALDVRIRWAKLADAAFEAAQAGLIVVGNRPQQKSPVERAARGVSFDDHT